ncbi:hypothetical protein C8Q70DRAFT_990766 [Cubamyces menziesii]|nr:hypothetical protein C8Q70DRAFT_990766 [Cubamyces menziesii]
MGRADGDRGVGEVGEGAVDEGGLGGVAFFDAPYAEGTHPQETIVYHRQCDEVLGEEEEEEEDEGGDVHRCFNCGSPDHVLSACPEPIDRALVSLSRQLFNFYRGGSGGPFQRVHEVEHWRQQRLQWLDNFEPGQIKGLLLRDALGLREGDVGEHVEWLKNMACWGYPPGWIGVRDPRERVFEIITDGRGDSDEECEFTIVGDEGHECLRLPPQDATSVGASKQSREREEPLDSQRAPRRWAAYPDSYFLWSKLAVYKGASLPALDADDIPAVLDSGNHTYSLERQALWQSILAGQSTTAGAAAGSNMSPWRIPGTCNDSASSEPPPPPGSPPPPPRPPPNSSPPPLPTADYSSPPLVVNEDDEDMDLSD